MRKLIKVFFILNKVEFNLYSYSTSRFKNLIDSIKTSMFMYVDSQTLIWKKYMCIINFGNKKKRVIIEIHEPLKKCIL